MVFCRDCLTKFAFVINLRTVETLDIDVRPDMLSVAAYVASPIMRHRP